MKCVVVVSTLMANIPLVECGGIALAPGDKLTVTEPIYKQMKAHYGKLLIAAEEVEVASLPNGHYKLESSERAAVKASEDLGPEGAESPVAYMASDKSMISKPKTKRK